MRILENQSDIRRVQDLFENSLSPHSTEIIPVSIGYQGGNFQAPALWLQSLDIWAYFGLPPEGKSMGKRYWNVFGINKPSGMVNIVCEVNTPIEGLNRKVAGAFAQGKSGEIYLVHRGILNARGRMNKNFVLNNFQDKLIRVQDNDRMSKMIQIGVLTSNDFPTQIKDFVFDVRRIKALWLAKH